MLISHTHKFVFVKTRKVGGTSLEKHLVANHFSHDVDIVTGSSVDNLPWVNCPPSTRGHMSRNEIVENFGYYLSRYNWFTIDRNPWDKCVSQYHFFRDNIKKIPKSMPFSEFLRQPANLPIDYPRYEQNNMVVIKWEEMASQLPIMFEYFGVKDFDYDKFSQVQLKNSGRKDHYSTMYRDDDVEIVRKAFYKEIGALNYEFEDRR